MTIVFVTKTNKHFNYFLSIYLRRMYLSMTSVRKTDPSSDILILTFQYGTATGSCGTISWQLSGQKLRIIIMWSVPFNLNVHSSYLALGEQMRQEE